LYLGFFPAVLGNNRARGFHCAYALAGDGADFFLLIEDLFLGHLDSLRFYYKFRADCCSVGLYGIVRVFRAQQGVEMVFSNCRIGNRAW